MVGRNLTKFYSKSNKNMEQTDKKQHRYIIHVNENYLRALCFQRGKDYTAEESEKVQTEIVGQIREFLGGKSKDNSVVCYEEYDEQGNVQQAWWLEDIDNPYRFNRPVYQNHWASGKPAFGAADKKLIGTATIEGHKGNDHYPKTEAEIKQETEYLSQAIDRYVKQYGQAGAASIKDCTAAMRRMAEAMQQIGGTEITVPQPIGQLKCDYAQASIAVFEPIGWFKRLMLRWCFGLRYESEDIKQED